MIIDKNLKPTWGFDGYWVDCEKGEVYSTKRGKLKKLSLQVKKGYLEAQLFNNGNQKNLLMQRLVYSSYYQCNIPDGMHVDHIDNNRKNNSISNLQLLTPKENSRKANLGKTHSEETKARISKACLGKKRKPFTEEHKAKISKAQSGKKHSAETKAKMSAAQKARWSGIKSH